MSYYICVGLRDRKSKDTLMTHAMTYLNFPVSLMCGGRRFTIINKLPASMNKGALQRIIPQY